jgi:hypothetical protein
MSDIIQWEYNSVEISIESAWNNPIDDMNSYGDEGWELVSSNHITSTYNPTMICIFKRIKQPKPPEQPLPQPPR